MKEKKYTVKEFCKKYNDVNTEQIRESLLQSIINPHYINYEIKITICKNIIESSYYKKDRNGNKKLYIDSPIQYLLYCLQIVEQYTLIKVDFDNVVEDFNLLNKSKILDEIINILPEYELKEFNIVLDMVRNDAIQNEYETHAFISNQIERFSELFGHIVKSSIDNLSTVIKNMDEKTVDSLIGKLKKIDKFKLNK